jgi:hypothetical protein
MTTELFQETANLPAGSETRSAPVGTSPAAAPFSAFRRRRYWVDWTSQLPITTLKIRVVRARAMLREIVESQGLTASGMMLR